MQETDKIIDNCKEISEFGRSWKRERQLYRLRMQTEAVGWVVKDTKKQQHPNS